MLGFVQLLCRSCERLDSDRTFSSLKPIKPRGYTICLALSASHLSPQVHLTLLVAWLMTNMAQNQTTTLEELCYKQVSKGEHKADILKQSSMLQRSVNTSQKVNIKHMHYNTIQHTMKFGLVDSDQTGNQTWGPSVRVQLHPLFGSMHSSE